MNKRRADSGLLDSVESKLSKMQKYLNNLTAYDFSSDDESVSAQNNSDPGSTPKDDYGDLPDVDSSNQESIKGETESSAARSVQPEIEINECFKDILGEDPSLPKSLDLFLNPSIITRLKFWTGKGLLRKDLEDLLVKYKRSDFSEAPKMNGPIESRMSPADKKRDEYKRQIQNSIGSALMAVGSAASTLITETESIDPVQIFESLFDALQILSDVFYKQSVARKAMVVSGFNKTVKEILDHSKPDEFLFGNDLVFKLKQAKAIEKVTADAKQQPSTSGTQFTKNFNRRPGFRPGPGPAASAPVRPRFLFKNNQKSPYNQKRLPKNETYNKPPQLKKKQ